MSSMVDRAKLRAWYSHRQGLDGSLQGASAAEVLKRAGWARSVGGVSPYLALFARAGITREQADAAAKNLAIHELPSARGCTYVLPASDFALGLAAGQPYQGDGKTALKLGVTEKEIARLCDSVLAALEKGPLDPDGLRAACGTAVRNLGDGGRKKGLATTLPVALEKLQASGGIRRISTNGRFDQQRYQYTLWSQNPLRDCKLSPQQAATELARAYFSWIGPAPLSGFQTFSGLGVKAALAAVEPLHLAEIKMSPGQPYYLLPPDLLAFETFQPPQAPRYSLLGSIDSLFLLPDFPDIVAGKDAQALGIAKELPSHAIVDRGRLAGLWEYDPVTESIAWVSLGKKDPALAEAVTRTENFVREQLGDARSFSLDSPKSRAPRIAALRKAIATA
jgi:Winged helix DNA-binding domain